MEVQILSTLRVKKNYKKVSYLHCIPAVPAKMKDQR